MRYAVMVFLTVVSSFCGVVKAADSFGDSPGDAPPNAADVYRAAISLYDQLPPTDKAALQTVPNSPADQEAADSLHGKIQPIIALLRQARSIAHTDWAWPATIYRSDDPVHKEQARVTAGRQNLARLTHWEAIYLFRTDPAQAVDVLASQEALGRTDVHDSLGIYVQIGIHMYTLRLLENYLAAIPASSATDIRYIVDRQAQLDCVKRGFAGETATSKPELAEYDNPATRQNSQLQKDINIAGSTVSNPQQMTAIQNWMDATTDDLVGTFGQTLPQFQTWVALKTATAPQDPLAAIGLKAAAGIAYHVRITMEVAAMVDAALQYEWNNKGRARSVIDPASGMPFGFKQVQGGTEIDSQMPAPIFPPRTAKSSFADTVAIPQSFGAPMTLLVPPPAPH